MFKTKMLKTPERLIKIFSKVKNIKVNFSQLVLFWYSLFLAFNTVVLYFGYFIFNKWDLKVINSSYTATIVLKLFWENGT